MTLFSSEMKDKAQSNQEKHEWWQTLCLWHKMKPPASCPSITRITSGWCEKPVLSWLTGCVEVCFLGGEGYFSWSTHTKHKTEEIVSLPTWACGLERRAVGFRQLQGMMGSQIWPGCHTLHMLCHNTSLPPSHFIFNAVTLLYKSARKMNYIGVPSLSYQNPLFQPTK